VVQARVSGHYRHFVISQNDGLLDTEKMMNNNQVSSLIVIVYYLVLYKYMIYKQG